MTLLPIANGDSVMKLSACGPQASQLRSSCGHDRLGSRQQPTHATQDLGRTAGTPITGTVNLGSRPRLTMLEKNSRQYGHALNIAFQ